MPTLQLIASRTGKPLGFFLSDRPALRTQPSVLDPRLVELEHLVEVERFDAARSLALDLLTGSLEPAAEAEINLRLGHALLSLGDPEAALPKLRRAKEVYQNLGDRWGYVDALDWEAACLYQIEDPTALHTTEEALRLCQQLDPRPAQLEVRILAHLGSLHTLRKDWPKAIRCFELAVEAAGPLRDIGRLAFMYNNLSVAYQETGNLAKAAGYAQRALAIHSLRSDRKNLARVENNLGLVLMRQGDFEAAARHLQTSLEHCEAIKLEHGRSHVLLSLGELHLSRGDSDRAFSYFTAAAELSARLGERLTLALSHQFLGQLAATRDDFADTDRQFGRAIALLNDEQAPERLIECHAAYAEALERRGDTEAANRHWKQALLASRPGLFRTVPLDHDLVARAN
jgi:tetratricopeptide (TPR) repeat protein